MYLMCIVMPRERYLDALLIFRERYRQAHSKHSFRKILVRLAEGCWARCRRDGP